MYNNYTSFPGNRMLPPGPQQYQPSATPDKMYRVPDSTNTSEPYMLNGAMTGGEMRPPADSPNVMTSAVMPEHVQFSSRPFRVGGARPQPQQQQYQPQQQMNPFMGGGFNPFMGGMGGGKFNPYQQMNPFMGGGGFNPFMGMMGGYGGYGGFNPFMGGMGYGGFGGFNPYQQMNPFMGGYGGMGGYGQSQQFQQQPQTGASMVAAAPQAFLY